MRCCQITNRYFYDAFKYVTTIIGAVTAAASKHLAATVANYQLNFFYSPNNFKESVSSGFWGEVPKEL